MSEKIEDFELIWQTYTSDQHENNYFIALNMFKASEYDLMDFCEWLYDTYCSNKLSNFFEDVTFSLSNQTYFYYCKIRVDNEGQYEEGLITYVISIDIADNEGAWDYSLTGEKLYHKVPIKVFGGIYDQERTQSIKMIHETLYFLWKY